MFGFFKFWILASFLSEIALCQSCTGNEALATQMQQIQQLALNQQSQLSSLASAQTWNTANQYATQLAQINQNLANQMAQLQNAYTNFPNCVYNGYPWGYYGYGTLASYYGYQQAWAPIQSAIYGNVWDPANHLAYVNQMQAANQAMLQQAQQAQWALVPPRNWK